jgi:metal-dependent HD superfamily phosphatase/phosphodiesterase
MVLVSNRLIHKHTKDKEVKEMFYLLQSDIEVQSYLRMSNIMAVERLIYNDHGSLHAKIVAGSALEILKRITKLIEPSVVENQVCDLTGAKIVVLCGSYLHDLGNSIHRVNHELSSCFLAAPILDRLLAEIYPDDSRLVFRLKSEVLHCIYSSDENIPCLSVEAGVTTVADGTDMAEGRTRIPYNKGKMDIHSLSALAIKKVTIESGRLKPVSIKVHMENPAGVYQIEEVLAKKLKTSGISQLVEVNAILKGQEIKTL